MFWPVGALLLSSEARRRVADPEGYSEVPPQPFRWQCAESWTQAGWKLDTCETK